MKSEFTFARDDSHRFLPWHIGTMVALATLLLALVVSLGGWVGSHARDYNGNMSVILPGSLDKLDEKSKKVQSLLKEQDGVVSINMVAESELLDMLEPWIGDGDALTDTALPIVIDVMLAEKTDAAVIQKSIRPKLMDIAPTIELDNKNSWADLFARFVGMLQALALVLVLVILVAMILMIAFSARASLHSHRRTVNLLHTMGAEDSYIAKQFQNEHFKISLKGATCGALVATAGFLLFGWATSSLEAAILPSFSIHNGHIALVVAMPFVCALIALISTRMAVLSQLKRVL